MVTIDSKNILVADDSHFFRLKLSDIFIEAGHKVDFAVDGKEAIDRIKANCDELDLVTLDMQMPRIDGFGVLRWIKENGYLLNMSEMGLFLHTNSEFSIDTEVELQFSLPGSHKITDDRRA